MSWMTQTEAAAALGCSIRTIRRRIRAGAVNARRDGRNLMVEVDTDKAMATVTQVGRQLAEVGAAAAIQRKQDGDALTTIQSTFKDTLSVLDTYRERTEREVHAYRRSARWGWGAASVVTIALVASGWLIHSERLARDRKLHQMASEVQSIRNASETAIVTTEIRHAGEMAAQTAKYDATSTVMQEALNHERQTVTSLDERLGTTKQALAKQAAELQSAKEERDRLARSSDRTVQRLQSALVLSRLKGTIKSLWRDMQLTGDRPFGGAPAEDLRGALDQVTSSHRADVELLQNNHKRELSQIVGRQDRIATTLQSALLEKEVTQQRLEQRNNELADKLIAAVTERSYLAAEHERLVRENADLRTEIERVDRASGLASSDQSVNPASQMPVAPQKTYGPTTAPRSKVSDEQKKAPSGKNPKAIE